MAPFRERRAELALLVGRDFERALQGGGRRIIDRADQARDIARGGRLLPAFVQRPAGLALEVDDENVVLDDQDLPEMEVAMVADVQAVDILWQQRAEVRAQGRALSQRLIDERTIGFLDRVASLSQRIKHPFGTGNGFVDPMLHQLRASRLRRKISELAASGELQGHHGHATTDMRHLYEIKYLILAFARTHGALPHTMLIHTTTDTT